jgi:hypothetical protein
MADTYTITIDLDDDTLNKLNQTGQYLRAYKGVKTGISGGVSTVWFKSNNFSNNMTVQWTEQYAGYISNYQQLKGGVNITAQSTKPMDLGETLSVSDNGTTVVNSTGQAGDIIIKNTGSKEWNCGMAQKVGSNQEASILCAFPLFGHYADIMMPYEKILLVFESGQIDTGTVIEETIGESIIITLDGQDKSRDVNYNIDTGWDAHSAGWAEICKDSVNIADKLILKI